MDVKGSILTWNFQWILNYITNALWCCESRHHHKKKFIVVSHIFWCNFHNCLEHPPSWNSQPIYRWLKFPVWIVQCRKSVWKKFRPFTSSPIVLSSKECSINQPLFICPSLKFKWFGLKKLESNYWTIFVQVKWGLFFPRTEYYKPSFADDRKWLAQNLFWMSHHY